MRDIYYRERDTPFLTIASTRDVTEGQTVIRSPGVVSERMLSNVDTSIRLSSPMCHRYVIKDEFAAHLLEETSCDRTETESCWICH